MKQIVIKISIVIKQESPMRCCCENVQFVFTLPVSTIPVVMLFSKDILLASALPASAVLVALLIVEVKYVSVVLAVPSHVVLLSSFAPYKDVPIASTMSVFAIFAVAVAVTVTVAVAGRIIGLQMLSILCQ